MKESIDFIVLIILYFVRFYKKWKAKGRETFFLNTLMYVYLSFVLYFTLMPIITRILFLYLHHYPYKTMNFVPFIDILMGRGDFLRQVVLNVIMMIPFGFLLPLTNKNETKLLKVIFFTFLVSLSIELLQPFNGRSSDITDIITNVIGGIIGYFVYFMFKPLIFKFLSYLK